MLFKELLDFLITVKKPNFILSLLLIFFWKTDFKSDTFPTIVNTAASLPDLTAYLFIYK